MSVAKLPGGRGARRGLLLALGLLWGCGGGGPAGCGRSEQVQARVAAASAYDRGRALLDQGDPSAAALAFAQAEALDPGSPTLIAWHARALEQAGQLDPALATLDRGLLAAPQDPDLLFNRAALRARQGQLDAAASDLRALYATGAVTPAQAALDADLVALRARPDLAALVPAPALELALTGEAGSVLLGDDYDAVLTLDLPEGALSVDAVIVEDMGQAPGLLRRKRVVEDVLAREGGRSLRRVELTWQAVAPGRAALGPWRLAVDGVVGLTPALELEVVAVGNRAGLVAPPAGEALVLPSTLLGDRSPPWVGELDGRLVVLGPPRAEVEVEVDGAPWPADERWELRDQAQPRVLAWLYPLPARARVRLHQGRSLLLDQAWPPPG